MNNPNNIWVDKYKPKTLEEFVGNKNVVHKLDSYIGSLRDNPSLVKNILISGKSGIGKTTLAYILLKKHNYRIIEFNASNMEGNKTIKTIMKNAFFHGNVLEMFNQDKRTTAIIIDELDALLSMGTKGGISELLTTLKKSVMKNKNRCNKIITPIIFTSKIITDKKITELKKFSKEFILKKPSRFEMTTLFKSIFVKENINFEEDALNLYVKKQNFDIRNNIHKLEYLCSQHKNKITIENINNYISASQVKDNDFQLFTGVHQMFYSKTITNDEMVNIYHMDNFLVPLLIHENYIKIIYSSPCKKKNLKYLSTISKYFMLNDILHEFVLKKHYWELHDYLPYHLAIPTNKIMKNLNIATELPIVFPSLFGKISQQLIKNRKVINFIMGLDNNLIRYYEVNSLLQLVEYYTITNFNVEYLVNNILMFYKINYEKFEELIRMNKNIYNNLKAKKKREIKLSLQKKLELNT